MSIKSFLMPMLDIKHKTFSYAVERNIAKIDSNIKHARKQTYAKPAFNKNEKFDAYLRAYMDLENKLGQRDENKRLVRDENDVVIPMDATVWATEFAALNKTYPKGSGILESRKDALREMDGMEFEMDFYKIRNEDGLPSDISARDRINLRFMFESSLIPEEVLEEEKEVEAEESKEEVKGEQKEDTGSEKQE